jgi:uncharacterized membrane protein (UPF0127 family)
MKFNAMTVIIFASAALILIGIFCLWRVVFSKMPNPALIKGQIRIGNAIFTVELATTTLEQARGLSFRENLADGSGMLFTFGPGVQNFWMKDMNFPIDIIWIAGGRVVGFVQDARPQPEAHLWELTVYASPNGVDKVLEVNAGVVAKNGINVGDTVTEGPGTE